MKNKLLLQTEIIAGITTFMTMAYILFVNANILSACGMNKESVMMATALSAGLATILIGLWTKYPFALAPGMGLNAYFAYSVCIGMKLPWQVALGAVFLDGVLFLILSILPVREAIIKGIPLNIKYAVSVGIGLFIALIGLQHAGIVVSSEATMITLGNVTSPSVLLVIFGLFFTAFLIAKKVKGALLWGIIITTVIGIFIPSPSGSGNLTKLPEKIFALPSLKILSETFLQLDILGAIKWGLLSIVFTFTFVDMFDTVGTVIGLASKLNIVDKSGSFPRAGKVLTCDAIGTIFGSLLGTSTVTTYVESAAGVSEGGRTGITAITTGILFLLALFFWPLAGIIPQEATAPALIIVGLLMMEPILKINYVDITESLPAFLTLVAMPLTYSIANGLIFGIITYTVLKLVSGRAKEISPLMFILSLLFILYFISGKH
ncbi:MAG: NCS2 family permease [Elusimicrobiota bacterium]|nr:NCS2 family permease [Elusimicrobiota bacterium]